MGRASAELLLSLRDNVSGPAKGIDHTLDRLSRRQGTFATGITGTTGATTKAASALGLYAKEAARAAAPLAAGFAAVDTIKSAASFETALSQIQKKGGLTEEALAGVRREILDIARSGKVAMDPAGLSGAYERGIAAGIPIEKLRNFTILSAQAADSWEMTGEAVGNAFAGFGETLKIPLYDMRQYADLINTLADAGISNESDIVEFLDRSGAPLKNLGLTNQTIAALGTTLLDLKVPASEAGTSMNTLATKLLTPKATKASTIAFTKLYGSVDKFQGMLKKDADGTLRDFLGRLSKLEKFERADIMKDIIGQDHSPKIDRLIGSLDLLDKRVALAHDPSKYVGSLSSSYQTKLKTMEAQWEQFAANLEALKIDLGTLILPPGKNFLGEATDAVQTLSRGIDDIKTSFGLLRQAFGGNAPGDFDAKGFTLRDIVDPWGNAREIEADTVGAASVKDLEDKRDNDKAVGAYGARDMGSDVRRALAATDLALRTPVAERTGGESYGAKKRRDYQTSRVQGYRSAEAESMQALKEQYGSDLAPNGQSFKPGTDVRAMVDDALSHFAGVVLTAVATIKEAKPVADTSATTLGPTNVPVPTTRPAGGAVAIPTPRPDIAAPLKAETDAAVLQSETAGRRIAESLSVTATPTVDMSGLDAFIAKARTAKAVLTDLGATANSVSAAASGKVGRVTAGAQASVNDLYSDIER